MKNALFFITLCSLLLAASCNTDDDATPDTSNDHDTLRCKINGEDWSPAGGDLFVSKPYSLYYYSYDGSLNLFGSSSMQALDLNCKVEELYSENLLWGQYIDEEFNSSCKTFEVLDQLENYILVSSIDSINYVMTGEFKLTVINNCNDTIKITDGYFDLDYRF